MTPCALRQQLGDRTRYRFRLVAVDVVRAEIRPDLGQRHEARAGRRRAVDEIEGRGDVRLLVVL